MSDPVSGTTVAAGGLMGASMFGLATGIDYGVVFGAFAGAVFYVATAVNISRLKLVGYFITSFIFAVMTQAGGAVTLPFVIQNGQTIIRDTVIGDGTIGNAKIGSYIQSSTWDGTGNVGWHINKSGYATFNNVTVRGSIYATNGNFSFNGSGNTTVINGNGVTINIPGGGRIVLGTW
ncbi:TPA: putative holin [Enterobacter kobei]